MINRRAKDWIYSKCGTTGNPKDVNYSRGNLPRDLSPQLVKRTLKALDAAGCITYRGLLRSDNAGGRTILELECLKDC